MADGSNSKEGSSPTKKRLYVLDTNVGMHDPTCLFNFKEHDLYISSDVIEEFDKHKHGHEERNRNTREVTRLLSTILAEREEDGDLAKGIPLSEISGGKATGRLFLQTEKTSGGSTFLFNDQLDRADNRILQTVQTLQEKSEDQEVVLVSKDLNMRIKGTILGLKVEDYHNDKVIEDTDLLPAGERELPKDFWDLHEDSLTSSHEGTDAIYELENSFNPPLRLNEFVFTDDASFNARVTKVGIGATEAHPGKMIFRSARDYFKANVWGVVAKNRGQNFALNLLMDPDIHLVTIVGSAGSGKTLLALAAGLEQTGLREHYSEIIFTRAAVSVGEEMGFLPGDEEEKMAPWMGALYDNLEVLAGSGSRKGKGEDESKENQQVTMEMMMKNLSIKSLSLMRGRSFYKKYVILDETQNLTPKEVKMVISRAGPGTKIVCLGNLAQIDTPYLTEGSCGLAFLVDRLKGLDCCGHIALLSGERSKLANYANQYL